MTIQTPHREMIRVRHSDRYETAGRLWLPAEPTHAVLYLHGIQSHGLWFEHSAMRLASAGCAVLLPDRRGSGRNSDQRGHAASPKRLLRDAADWLDELHVRTGLSRFHIVGVSWGGKYALGLQRHQPERISGITLIAPGIFPKVDVSLWDKIRIGLAAAFAPLTMFSIPLNDPALFTANPQRQTFIREDPLSLHEVTASFLMTSKRLDGIVRGRPSGSVKCPLTLMLAGQDRIIDNEPTQTFAQRIAPQCNIINYEHAAHTLEFEPQPQAFFDDLIESVSAQ